MNQGAIILCGGASTRMGRDKASLPFGPLETMLQRVVRLVAEVVPHDGIVCVAAAGQELPTLPAGVEVVRDAEPHCGPLAGFAAGVAALQNRAEAVFACGCDVPLLVPAFVDRMFVSLGEHKIAAVFDGERFHPLSAVYRTDVRRTVEALLASGERSLVSLVEHCDTHRVPLGELRDVDPSLASLENCNTLVDYQRALRTLGFQA